MAPDALMIGARSCSCLRRNAAVSAGLIQFVVAACWTNVFFRFSLCQRLLGQRRGFLDHGRRQAGGAAQAAPRGDVEARIELRHRRQLRRGGMTFGRRDGERLHLAGLVLDQRRGDVVVHHVELTREHVLHRRRTAAIGHMLHVEAGALLQHLAAEMRAGARSAGAEEVLAGIGLHQGHQLRHRVRRKGELGDEDVGHRPQHADRREVLLGIERQLGVERRRDRVAGDGVEPDRVAVGRRLGEDVGADIAARTALVLDDELLAGELAQFLADDARQHVGGGTCREGVDVAHRLGRPVGLGTRDARCDHRGRKNAASGGEYATTR